MDGADIVAAAPIFLEDDERGRHHLSFAGEACWSPAIRSGLSSATRTSVLIAVLRHIRALADHQGALSVALRVSPLARNFATYTQDLLAATSETDYKDSTLLSTVVMLPSTWDEARRAMRRDHRSRIRRAADTMPCDVLDALTMAEDDFDAYVRLHALAAGRVTRPPSTFEAMRAWVKAGSAVLVRCRVDGRAVGFHLVLVEGDCAYSGSIAVDPTFDRAPVGHVLHAETIRWLVEQHCLRYELGPANYRPLRHYIPTSKELSITMFKGGFGGKDCPVNTWECFFDPGYENEVSAQRDQRFAEASSPS